MDEKELYQILRAARALDIQGAPEQHRHKTPHCPSLPRFRDLVYHPSTWTPREQLHMRGCRYCQMMLKICEQEAKAEEPVRLGLAFVASGGLPAAAEENPQGQLSLIPVGTFEAEGVSYDTLADSEDNIFLDPAPGSGKTHLVLGEKSYALGRIDEEGRCQVIGLGPGELELSFALGRTISFNK